VAASEFQQRGATVSPRPVAARQASREIQKLESDTTWNGFQMAWVLPELLGMFCAFCRRTMLPRNRLRRNHAFPSPQGRGIKGEGERVVGIAAGLKFLRALPPHPDPLPWGEGETLGRARQRSHVWLFLGNQNESFFRWFLRLVSETQPRSVRFSRACRVTPFGKITRSPRKSLCRKLPLRNLPVTHAPLFQAAFFLCRRLRRFMGTHAP
jgi:hypothetical protein